MTNTPQAVTKQHARCAANIARGFTLDGRVGIYRVPDPMRQGQLLKAEIDAAAQAIGRVFEYLPADAQARCVQLALTLAVLRQKI